MAIGNATRAKLARVEQVGSLHGAHGALADSMVQTLRDGSKVMWTDDEARVFAAPASEEPNLPPQWVIGIFHSTQSRDEISDALFRASRARQRDLVWSKAG